MIKIRPYLIDSKVLEQCVNPLKGFLWGCEPITIEEVQDAVDADDLEERAWDTEKTDLQGPGGRDFHIKRIAYFVKNGLPTDEHNIQVNVGGGAIPGSNVSITNGNHRIAAALIRGDKTVRALIYTIDASDVEKFLPGSTPTI